MKNWKSMEEVFALLNKKCRYLILRNYEGFFDDILIEGHNDIDVLCASKQDRKNMVNILQATTRIGIDNGIHYKFMYRDKEVALDIRTVGDGYYDEKWQKNMIKNRIYNDLGFYTMNTSDYFYSLIYHAIYQKKEFSEEYSTRLQSMDIKTKGYSEQQFEEMLYDFMTKNDYYYTKTYDKYVLLYFNQEIVRDRFKYPYKIKIKHLCEKIEEYILGKLNGARVRCIKYIKNYKDRE